MCKGQILSVQLLRWKRGDSNCDDDDGDYGDGDDSGGGGGGGDGK